MHGGKKMSQRNSWVSAKKCVVSEIFLRELTSEYYPDLLLNVGIYSALESEKRAVISGIHVVVLLPSSLTKDSNQYFLKKCRIALLVLLQIYFYFQHFTKKLVPQVLQSKIVTPICTLMSSHYLHLSPIFLSHL